jgi:intracellular protein transport protein USO1
MFSTIANAPAKQSVGETIAVLSGRLNSATLLEDRRAAILGLRSFAKDYPASVSSGALRSLIGSLSKDGEDVDTVKVVLETLLMLFDPNPDSPEASEDIALWLADEFTQRQENVTLLLDFLETNDFYSRLYSLQLLSAVLSARADRTEACVFAAPLGISSLVAVLEDRRDAVRNEAVSLLTYLTPTSPDIQKAIAFQGAFQRIFAIIAAEGSLSEGDRIVEDCLVLLVNLLRLNPSNQYTFREEGYIANISQLLKSTYEPGKEAEEVAQWAQQQGSRNTYALLAIVRLFLTPGEKETAQNQRVFWQQGVLYHALQLAFAQAADVSIRAEALTVCSEIIRGNRELQEGFAQLQVPSVLPNDVNGVNGKTNGISVTLVYVIDALLDLTLSVTSLQLFDLRMAACECLKAYLYGHDEIRLHFLHRAIEGYSSGSDETANVLTTLLQPSASTSNDPYRHWFASIVMFHLLHEPDDGNEPKAKALAMSLTEGDAESGEEVVTSIQTITAHLLSGLKTDADERVVIGYLMLLIGWLWHNPAGVDDFLGEGSHLQGLTEVVQEPKSNAIVRGLSAMLLGIIYEYSTRESPIPRSSLHEALLSRMSRGNYQVSLRNLLKHPLMRDFDVIPQKADDSGELPEVFFDATFVEFYKDHCNHVVRVIDTDPAIETSVVVNGEEIGVSRQLVDDLRAELDAVRAKQDEYYQNWQSSLMDGSASNKQLGQQLESTVGELNRIKSLNEALHRNHENEVKTLHRKHEEAIRSSDRKYEESLKALQRKHDDEGRAFQRKHEQESKALQRKVDQLENQNKTLDAENKDVKQKFGDALRANQRLEEQLRSTEEQATNKTAEIQRQLDYVKKTSEAEAARKERRTGAEIAELRANISRLELDLMKAAKTHAEEIESARAQLEAETAKAKEAEKRAQDFQTQLNEAQESAKNAAAQLEARAQQLEADFNSRLETAEAGKADELKTLRSDLEKKFADDLAKALAQLKQEHADELGEQRSQSEKARAELEKGHADKLEQIRADLKREHADELEKSKAQLEQVQSDLQKATSDSEQQKNDELEKAKSQLQKALEDLAESKSQLKKSEDESKKAKTQSKQQKTDEVEKLKEQLKKAEDELQNAKSQSKKQKDDELEKLKGDLKKAQDELQKSKSQSKQQKDSALEKLQAELKKAEDELQKAKSQSKQQKDSAMEKVQAELKKAEEELQKFKSQSKQQHDSALEKLQTELKKAEDKLQKASSEAKTIEEELQKAKSQSQKAEEELSKIKAASQTPKDELQKAKAQLDEINTVVKQKDAELKTKDEERVATQTELDDLLMVFGDLEERVEKYKVSLHATQQTLLQCMLAHFFYRNKYRNLVVQCRTRRMTTTMKTMRMRKKKMMMVLTKLPAPLFDHCQLRPLPTLLPNIVQEAT